MPLLVECCSSIPQGDSELISLKPKAKAAESISRSTTELKTPEESISSRIAFRNVLTRQCAALFAASNPVKLASRSKTKKDEHGAETPIAPSYAKWDGKLQQSPVWREWLRTVVRSW